MQHVLERDHLRADLAGVDAILARMGEHDDPIGYSQLIARRAEIEEALRAPYGKYSGGAECPELPIP